MRPPMVLGEVALVITEPPDSAQLMVVIDSPGA